jgi:hypothetical protein
MTVIDISWHVLIDLSNYRPRRLPVTFDELISWTAIVKLCILAFWFAICVGLVKNL